MMGSWIKRGLWTVGAVLTIASVSFGSAYTEIQNNAFDGVNDATYVNHVLTWSSNDVTGFNMLTLIEDTGVVPGFTGDVSLSITSTFQNYNSTLQNPARALFAGGVVDLTFQYSPTGAVWTSHQLRGTISQGSVEITSTSPTLSTLTGIFNFNTNAAGGMENLPSSNNWPAPGYSTAVALSFAIGADLSPLKNNPAAWDSNIPQTPSVVFDTQFSFYPEERPIPEPASMALLVMGCLVALRRRH